MSRLRSLWRNLRHRGRVERELDEEIKAVVELLTDEQIARGLPASEARRAAAMQLGGVESLKDRIRDVKMGALIETACQDVRYAARLFRRSPGFSATAVLTLALGIGANTAMFSVINTLVLQRLAIPEPDKLFSMSSYNERGQKRYVPMPTVIDLNQHGPFVEACGYNGGGIVPVEAHRIATQGIVAFVSGRCFSVFGVQPMLGRGIIDTDAPIMAAGAKSVVISERLWERLFQRDPGAIGQSIRVDSTDAVVIGILPAAFRGIHADIGVDVFAPPDSIIPATEGRRPVAQEVLGRLKPGVTPAQAQAQLDGMWPALLSAGRVLNQGASEGQSILGATVRLEPMGKGLSPLRNQYSEPITIIFGLTALLLLLACINLGGLMLTRLNARSTELGIRLAIGGSRARIVQQMFVESLLLASAGALLAVPTAYAFVTPLPSMIGPGMVGWDRAFAPDLRVLSVTAAIGFAVSVMLTTLPAWFAVRRQASVRFAWDRTITRSANLWTRSLLIAQVSLSMVLVVGAALLSRSLFAATHANPGVRTEGILTARLMAAPGGRGLTLEGYYLPLFEQLRGVPGVANLSYSAVFPRRISDIASDVGFVGENFTGVRTSLDNISTNFFDMMRIPLIAGRTFTDTDNRNSRRVVVLSESLARALAPDANILERHLRFQTQRSMQDLVVVGVVGNATQGNLKATDVNVMYLPALQQTLASPNVMLEVSGDPAPVAAAVRRLVAERGREFVTDVSMLDELLARSPSRERLSAMLSGIVGTLALLLAVIGIHGVLTYSVGRRTREIGVRIAVGALPSAVARDVIRDAATVVVVGVVTGIPAALLASRALRSLLFGVSETDAVSFGASAVAFVLVGVMAAALPARRAARVDPVRALRAD